MNATLLFEKSAGNKCYDLFHVLFPLILFFGGLTQVAIIHGGRWMVIPEFLQFIALALLLLFALGKLLKNPWRCGYFFPVPFLLQHLLPWTAARSVWGPPLEFLFGGGFSLFPWLGFVLFGVFILGLEKKYYRALQAALLAAFVLSYWVAGIPLSKFWMSLSYLWLALSAIMLAVSLGRAIALRAQKTLFRHIAEFFALPGRNALMFVYLHYFVMRAFVMDNFISSDFLMLALQSFYLFLLCVILLKFYEKVKTEAALFLPSLIMAAVLAGVSWVGLVTPRSNLQLVDMAIGILFAFLYVQLRRRCAAFCELRVQAGV